MTFSFESKAFFRSSGTVCTTPSSIIKFCI
jgi:hypothetical protein